MLGQPKTRDQSNKGCELRKIWIFRAILFLVLVLFDLITIPYGLSLREPATDQVYVTNFYGVPQDMKYDVPDDVRTAENSLVNSFKARYPHDTISSNSFLVSYEYRNDNTTAGYSWPFIPVYAIYVYRTYQTLNSSGYAVLTWTVIFDVLIALMIIVPIDFLEEHYTEKLEASYSSSNKWDIRDLKAASYR
jgi:hypothetical protein